MRSYETNIPGSFYFQLDTLIKTYISDRINYKESVYFYMVTNLIPPRRKQYIDANLAEYGEESLDLPWISNDRAILAERQRRDYIQALGKAISFLCKQTKPVYGKLSPGCQICGQGDWSCLFINGKCNCRCFYCPTVQNDISVPTTNRIPFTRTIDYADYIDHFDFKGASISGGEPLLTFDRSLNYIKSVRQKMGDNIHLWLYTNGTLLSDDYISRLRDAGLNEIRFDISAANYNLDKIKLAAGKIPHITVEIPAIPEDQIRLKELIPMMNDVGVNYLNLHQLRLTPFNQAHLKQRPYTFLHGEKVTVLESELMVLSLLKDAVEQKWAININYCSFIYKNRFQRAATRKRNARFILKGHESVTENGFIRSLSVTGDADLLMRNVHQLLNKGVSTDLFSLSSRKDRLYFHKSLWPDIDFHDVDVKISYLEAMLRPAVSYQHAFKEIRLNAGKKIVVEKKTHASDIHLSPNEREIFEKLIINTPIIPKGLTDAIDDNILLFELIYPGLQDYF